MNREATLGHLLPSLLLLDVSLCLHSLFLNSLYLLGFLSEREERYVQRLAVETTCRWHLWEVREFYFVLIMKSHLQSYPCPLQINFFWNLGFLLGIIIILQIITGIFLGLHYTSDLNSAYSCVFFAHRRWTSA